MLSMYQGWRGILGEAYNLIYQSESSGNKIFLGDFTAAYDEEFHEKEKIKAILTVATGLHVTIKDKSIIHKVINAYDEPGYKLSPYFPECFTFIDNNLEKGNVYVHCAAGVSRSATVVIAYIMKKNKWDYAKTREFVQKKRRVIGPNNGFVQQLKNYESELNSDKVKKNSISKLFK